MKPLEELNQEFISEIANMKKKRGKAKIILNVVFFVAVLALLFSMIGSLQNDAPKPFLGYTFFTVLTSSMQDEIPKDSLILVHQTEPHKLKTGDNITFTRGLGVTVTHKIAYIYENYQNSGTRGFQTKGVNNANPDKDIVPEENIIGKVIFTLPLAGAALSWLGDNIYVVFIIFGLCAVIYLIFRTKTTKERNEKLT